MVLRVPSRATGAGSTRGLQLSGTGTLQIGGGANYTGNTQINGVNAFSFSESTGVLSVIPEPTTTVLFISLGVAVFAIFRRRKVA